MSTDLHESLVLMMVGMITVFIILSLVVLLGKGLILITNKYNSVHADTEKNHRIVITKAMESIGISVEKIELIEN